MMSHTTPHALEPRDSSCSHSHIEPSVVVDVWDPPFQQTSVKETKTHQDPEAIPTTPLLAIPSKGSWIAAGVLFLCLITIWALFLTQRATTTPHLEYAKLPVTGNNLTLTKVSTFWKSPKLKGQNADKVRRGTLLIPACTIETEKSPATIRVEFKNCDQQTIGDRITRNVKPGEPITITATAGFNDLHDFDAHRLNPKKTWLVILSEAPSESSLDSEFTTLGIFPISITIQ